MFQLGSVCRSLAKWAFLPFLVAPFAVEMLITFDMRNMALVDGLLIGGHLEECLRARDQYAMGYLFKDNTKENLKRYTKPPALVRRQVDLYRALCTHFLDFSGCTCNPDLALVLHFGPPKQQWKAEMTERPDQYWKFNSA